MRHRSVLRRSRRLLAAIGTVFAVLALTATGPAVASAPDDPLTMISNDGTITRATTLSAVPPGALSGFAGTGLIGTDGADHDADLAGTTTPVVGPYSVIGTDGRLRQNPTSGSVQSRSTVQLTYTNSSGTYQFCSGWLFGPDTVITAGHCVYDYGKGTWAHTWGTLQVWPGRNGASNPTYGTCSVRSLHSVLGWTRDGDRGYDMGAMKLNCSVGNTTGWMGAWYTSSNLVGTQVFVRGYPCDKAYGTQWWDDDLITSTTSDRLWYTVDTYGCQSGSPVYNSTTGGCLCVLAIHTNGGTTANIGTRITQAKFERIFAWRNL